MGPRHQQAVDASRQGARDFSPSGEWLFKQGELTLGPVSGAQLAEKLYSGEVGGHTLVTPLGEERWQPLRQLDGFKLHLAKAEAKLRVDASARAQAAHAARARNTRLAVVGGLTLAVAVAAAWGARYLAVHNPWKSADELALADITVEPPRITAARRTQEELADYPLDGAHGGKRAGVTRAASGRVGAGTRTEADGMQLAQFDQGAINGVVSARQKSLYPCFSEEARRTPGLYAHIPIEFVIGNDGKVAKLWVDNPTYKEGPLAECLLRELQKWPFKPYEGERATVSLSFQIGKKG